MILTIFSFLSVDTVLVKGYALCSERHRSSLSFEFVVWHLELMDKNGRCAMIHPSNWLRPVRFRSRPSWNFRPYLIGDAHTNICF